MGSGFFILLALIGACIFFLWLIWRYLSAEAAKKQKDETRTIQAQVINKRTHISGINTVNTGYYIAFQTNDGHRFELWDKNILSGLITIGDVGTVTYYQNTLVRFNLNNPK
jgi:hypothetical protein